MEDTERWEVGRALSAVGTRRAMEKMEVQSFQQRLTQLPGQDPGVLGHHSFPSAKDVDLASKLVFKGSLAASPKGQAILAP